MVSPVPRTVLILFALCLLGACVVHVADLWQHGRLPYHFAPFPLNAYWTALTFLDAFAAVLLLSRPRTGLALALLISASDEAPHQISRFSLTLHLPALISWLPLLCFV